MTTPKTTNSQCGKINLKWTKEPARPHPPIDEAVDSRGTNLSYLVYRLPIQQASHFDQLNMYIADKAADVKNDIAHP